MIIHVECYAGYRADERPVRFIIGNQTIEVHEIIDRWHGVGYRYFKVVGNDNNIYLLRHDEERYCWELTFFKKRFPHLTS